jgi:hypothetical protein
MLPLFLRSPDLLSAIPMNAPLSSVRPPFRLARRLFVAASFALLVGVTAAASTGCVSRYGPGGATPGLFYSNVAYPNAVNPNMDFRIVFDREDIEILGPVTAESSSKWWFFLVSHGDSGFGTLMDEVRAMGGDGVMNLTIDTQYKNVFLFYARVTTRLTGTAYRYKRGPITTKGDAAADGRAATLESAARKGDGEPTGEAGEAGLMRGDL